MYVVGGNSSRVFVDGIMMNVRGVAHSNYHTADIALC